MEGINRLAKMLEGQKDKYLNIIVNHLMQHLEFDQAFLNEEKNLKDMADYIKDKARKEATGGVAVIEDAVVFKWAIDYFVKSNEELKIKKTTKPEIKKEKNKQEESDDEFGSIFDSNDENESFTTECAKAEKESIEQISLFGI